MRLHQETDNVEIRGAASAASSFSIAMNPKAFRVLSSNLYQNKIGSIVREISCNAADSHTAAGNPEKPFEIHLPDAFEPWFSVRDYGVGLSPEQVRTVLCVYFASTKDQSNDAVGAFGLGAKTPFAYTDQFNVTSVYEGRKYLFAAFINSEGIPDITLMLEEATDEPNGVEIKLSVEKKDFRDFQNEVRTQLRFFPVKPIIQNYGNGATFEFEKESDILFQTSQIRIFKSLVYGRQPIYIVQGPVGYPLDLAEMTKHLTSEENAFLKFIGTIGANMYFNIGDIGVTASREGIEYEGITIDSIRANIDASRIALTSWIKGELDKKKNVYEKIEFINDNTAFKNIINGISMDLKPAIRNYNDTYQLPLAGCSAYYHDVMITDTRTGTQSPHRTNAISFARYTNSGVNGFSSSRGSDENAVLLPSKNSKKTVIVLRDTAKTPLAKMKHYFRENKVENMLVLTSNADAVKFDDAFVKALTAHLGGFDKIVRVSDMPDPPKAVYDRVRADYTRPTCYRSYGGYEIESVANWTRCYDKLADLKTEDGDDIERALYVTVVRQKVSDYHEQELFKNMCRAEEIDLPLYGIRESDVEKLDQTGIEWIKLSDYIKEKQKAILSNPKLIRYSLAAEVVKKIDGIVGSRFDELPNLHKRAVITRLLRLRNRSQKIVDTLNINAYALRIAGYNPEGHKALEIVKNSGTKMFDKVPMLRYAMRHGYGAITGAEAEHISDYINKSHS